MSDEPLTNAAVEFIRVGMLFLNEMERDEIQEGASRTDDFVFEDRRSGVNFGVLESSAYTELIRTTWDLGSGRPSWSIRDVIAVRGQRIAVMTFDFDYGDDMLMESCLCVCLDRSLQRLQREVHFDVDARHAAIALLDEWHAEICAEPDTPS